MAQATLTTRPMESALDLGAEHEWNLMPLGHDCATDRSTRRAQADNARSAGPIPFVRPPKPRIRVPARSVYQPTPDNFAGSVGFLVWECAHYSPTIPDKTRFANAGKLAAHLEPDYIVDLGDTMDMDSLS